MSSSRLTMLLAAAMLAAAFALLPASAVAASSSSSGGASTQSSGATTGGVSPNDPEFRPAGKAKLINGMAIPPADAPPEVVNAIAAANKIVGKPYKWGGGHGKFEDSGYDCSGSVSYALAGAGLLTSPLDSSSFMRWGKSGKGKWFTIYTNPGHAFVLIAGLRLDTGMRDNSVRGVHPGSGPRWAKVKRSTRGFSARHPDGF
jgi:hypothetical protein